MPGHFHFRMMASALSCWLKLRRPLFWAALAFSYVAAIWPGSGAPTLGGSDKTDHVTAFVTLTLLAAMAYPQRSRLNKAAWLSIYGAFIELSQATSIVGRDASVADWIADSAAIIVASVISLAMQRALPALFATSRSPEEGMASIENLSVQQDSAAQREFDNLARALSFDPADLWVGGYAEYEWHHLRYLLQAYSIRIEGADVLEFGCNVGGSSVVMAALQSRLIAVDIEPAMVSLTQANLARHGLEANVLHIADTRMMPIADGSFDFILANSVFEYVEPAYLDAIIAELHRLLRPGGQLLVCGTANRLALRERHSGRWFVNYLPKAFDKLVGRPLQRGLSPFRLARATDGLFVDATGAGWGRGRGMIHGRVSPSARLVAWLGRKMGRSPGWFTPYIEVLLQKPLER